MRALREDQLEAVVFEDGGDVEHELVDEVGGEEGVVEGLAAGEEGGREAAFADEGEGLAGARGGG